MNHAVVFGPLARDLSFVLYDVLNVDELCDRPAFAGHERDDFDALIDAAIELAADAFAPCAAELDAQEPHVHEGRVVLPDVLRDVIGAYIDGGYLSAAIPGVGWGPRPALRDHPGNERSVLRREPRCLGVSVAHRGRREPATHLWQ